MRRVMLEHYGYERYLDSGARPLHRDETGALWRIDLDGDEPVVMVEVLNSTPEPDGSRRTYWLRVPPSTRTARQGVAWTFGLHPGGVRAAAGDVDEGGWSWRAGTALGPVGPPPVRSGRQPSERRFSTSVT